MKVAQGIFEVGQVVVIKFRSLYACVYNKSNKVTVKKLKKLKPRNICQGILDHTMGNLPSYIVCDSEIYLNVFYFFFFPFLFFFLLLLLLHFFYFSSIPFSFASSFFPLFLFFFSFSFSSILLFHFPFYYKMWIADKQFCQILSYLLWR